VKIRKLSKRHTTGRVDFRNICEGEDSRYVYEVQQVQNEMSLHIVGVIF